MQILFITQLFPYKKGNQNTSSALREFIEEWDQNGNTIKVIRPHFNYEKEPFPPEKKFKIGHQIDVEFIKPIRIPLVKISFYPNKKILKNLDFKPDIIITHLYNSYFLFHKLSKILNVPLVIGIHMADVRISKNPFHRKHQKSVFKKASGFACRSFSIKSKFSERFPEFNNKAFLVPSGIPKNFIRSERDKNQRY